MRVNNPTLGVFCYTMIGRADIEESKSDVAMNAWPPQASYPCGNFSGTCKNKEYSCSGFAGSIGHPFGAGTSTGGPGQTSFYPFILREVSVRTELILGHLCYCLTDVPPQPNSPSENVFGLRRTCVLGPRSGACAPSAHHRISETKLPMAVFHWCRSSRLFYTRQFISRISN